MHGADGDQQRGLIAEWKHNFGVFTTVCGFLSAPLSAIFARAGTMGERFQGFPMLIGVLLQFLVVVLVAGPTGGDQALYMLGFMVIVLLSHRIHRARVKREGFRCHSMYTGVPCIPGDELAVKGVVIPAITLFAGLLVLGLAKGVGAWLILASIALAVTTSVYRQQLDAQTRAVNDARIEQDIVRHHHQEQS